MGRVNAGIYVATKTLTNAQIKALPTTPIAVVAAPGAGYRNRVIAATMNLDAAAAAYTNINDAYAALVLAYVDAGSAWAMQGPVNDNSVSPEIDGLYNFLGVAQNATLDFVELVGATPNGWVLPPNVYIPGFDAVKNLPIVISIDNNGSGALTGGNAANYLQVTVYYAIEVMP